jgi:hypothetical protein
MKALMALVATFACAGTALAGDVYVTKDANGNLVYTDTPQTVPAKRLDIRTADPEPSPAPAPARDNPQTQQNGAPQQASASSEGQEVTSRQSASSMEEDRVKRCSDARQQYQTLMNSWRIFDEGPDGERVYLTSDQIDAARQNAKQVMDQFCGEQEQ